MAAQVPVAKEGLLAVQRDIFRDSKSGVAAEVEKVTLTVPVGEGEVAVMGVRAVTLSNLPSLRRDPPPGFDMLNTPLLTAPYGDPPEPATLQGSSAAPRKSPSLLCFKDNDSDKKCCSCCYLIVVVINVLLILAIVLVLFTAPSVGGTLSCDPLKAAGQIFIACGVFALLTTLCCLATSCSPQCFSKKNLKEALCFCCGVTLIPLTVVVGLTIGVTAGIAGGVTNGTLLHGGEVLSSCKNTEIPIILDALSWFLCLLLFGCGCLTCICLERSEKDD